MMISYAQNREDVLLWRVFRGLAKGFYIDIGAGYPRIDSVTKWFYDQGWQGINVEPSSRPFAELAKERRRDVNISAAVSNKSGPVTLFEVPDRPGWETVESEVAEGAALKGHPVVQRQVEAATLADICAKHAPTEIAFLKIDVEGHERAVLEGADFSRWRPIVVVVEATEQATGIPNHFHWEELLLGAAYEFAFFDGLNRYYVRKENAELLERLAVPVNFLDMYVLPETVELGTLRQELAGLQMAMIQLKRKVRIVGFWLPFAKPLVQVFRKVYRRLCPLRLSS